MKQDDLDRLVSAAREAQKSAYAPYSGFHVGAAILNENGEVNTGCNVENAAYPQGSCAEASAISAMIMSGTKTIKAIAIVGPKDEPCPPCGGCRQRIREFAALDTPVILLTGSGSTQTHLLDDLLPHSFGPENLTDLS